MTRTILIAKMQKPLKESYLPLDMEQNSCVLFAGKYS